ncbi:MAG: type II secretion system protein [Lysobacter sp.]
MQRNRLSPSIHSNTGFTMIEMSVVLVIIALLVGAVTVGRDVYRAAAAERLGTDFVQGWLLAYDQYVAGVGTVPGDNFDNPSGRINNGTNNFLCEDTLLNAMLARGVTLPAGRGEGLGDRYVYQDSRGVPHEVSVCFAAVQWSEPSTAVGVYANRPRNVMRLRGLTPELATMLDARIDGRVDARHGRFREVDEQDVTNALGVPWSLDSTDTMSGSTDPDAQVAEMGGYVRMSR